MLFAYLDCILSTVNLHRTAGTDLLSPAFTLPLVRPTLYLRWGKEDRLIRSSAGRTMLPKNVDLDLLGNSQCSAPLYFGPDLTRAKRARQVLVHHRWR